MAKIIIKNDVLELFLYMWDSIAQRQKISESILFEVADHKDMKYLYDDDFSKDSLRKVLSAISNRELLNNITKKESRFWSNNMWMLEDMEFTNSMIKPVKQLNLDDLRDKLSKDEYEVIFIPGHIDEYYIDGNKLVINYFKIMTDMFDNTPARIGDKPLKEYIEEKLLSI
ncbi:hypothetical protein E9840_04025 [Tissierella creatinini]|nr:hypothetical protein E9840_04025 [Tissierella creatinini]TJX67368.1 hypothetical protein E8P77_05275 [Soehngenia saccharolytica]